MKTFLTHALGIGLMLALAHAGYARSPAKSTDKPTTDKPVAGTSGAGASARHKSAHMHHGMMPSRTAGHSKFSHPNPAGKAPMMHKSRHVSHSMHRMPARHSSYSYGWRPNMVWSSMPRFGWMNPYTYWPDRNGPVAMYSGANRGWGYGHHHHYRGHHHGHGHHHHRHA